MAGSGRGRPRMGRPFRRGRSGKEGEIMADAGEDHPRYREVRFEYSREFPRILEHLRAALLISTYQAGKLAVVGVHQGQLTFAFHSVPQVMGVAVGDHRI